MEKSLSFKEKLNIFQKSIDDVDKINITKSFDKIKSSGKKVMIFGDLKNDKKENNIYNKILQFFKEKPVFPCLLISKDDNGKIEMNMHCLKDINIDNIKLIKEEGFEITKRKDAYYYQIIDFSNFQFDISVIHNNINFSSKAKNIEKISKINNLIIGKYKLYSFNINEGELSFNSHFLKKFEEIANNSSSDQIKAKEIDEIFENQGYYIPLKIYIGGIFINRYNDKNYKLFKEDINLSGEDIRKIFINENTQIIGGEKSEKNFELWT